jgi:Eco57I restriction-modification methylase
MSMTPEAKKLLSATIRALRARLLDDLHAATEAEYQLGIARVRDAKLSEAAVRRRRRLEDWLEEQVRAQAGGKKKGRTREEFRREVEQRAGYTWLNRLVVLRVMEATGLRGERVVTGGWESSGYQTFRELAPALVQGEASEGFAFLLRLVCEELAVDLPGLFGGVAMGVAELVPLPASTLRHMVEVLDDKALRECWEDDMTLGWVYQYWNDPEREALDAKLNARGKLESYEIASKTQMFTERYMVDWLLQNSLGPMWLAICAKHGWVAEVERDGVLVGLEARRVEWRGKRERGEVELTELMPLEGEVERRWAYYVPQPLPKDAVEQAAGSVRELKILDPAVGSGHFLVVAFDLLVGLYEEEARQRGKAGEVEWSERAIVEAVLEENLHGIDLDPRAVQIAAAALWLKARQRCAEAQPRRMRLVASQLRLASLGKDDPALVELREGVEWETGIPEGLTNTIVEALAGADHLGSLLRVESAVEEAIEKHENEPSRRGVRGAQGSLFGASFPEEQRELIGKEEARETILEALEAFLRRHTHGEDLGLRLRGEQLAAGVRFVRMVREGQYDLVVGNPPYQGTKRMEDARYVEKHFPLGRADLYAAFMLRALELSRVAGLTAMVTMKNWMFIKQFGELRRHILQSRNLQSLADLGTGAFQERSMDDVISTALLICWASPSEILTATAIRAAPSPDPRRDSQKPARRRAALSAQAEVFRFKSNALDAVPDWPLVYWWTTEELDRYKKLPKLADLFQVRQGLCTGDNARMLRHAWEPPKCLIKSSVPQESLSSATDWVPFMKGGESRSWMEPLLFLVNWRRAGLEIKVGHETGFLAARPQNESFYFRLGVAVQTAGSDFSARIHRYASVFGDMARSVFPENLYSVAALLNSTRARRTVESLNPTIHFTVGDLKRLPFSEIPGASGIGETIEAAFSTHESHREPSVEYHHPGASPWRHAQAWAQLAVDRPEHTPLPPYTPELDPEPPTDHLSHALGVALGRFSPTGSGILDPTTAPLDHALPAGILFLDTTLDPADHRDSLGHPAAAPLLAAWDTHGPSIAPALDLRAYLTAPAAKGFFDLHRKTYESRPIHWPLASAKRTYVAWITIHRFTADTLRLLLADHLTPTLTRLEGELADLRAARDSADKKASRAAEKRLATVLQARDELSAFVVLVQHCAEKGPPPPQTTKPEREVDARYDPDLDDGVMINSAALWPLLAPLWKDPAKHWKELAAASGKKDYDWSHLAMRYWPTRVDAKCRQDPSLAVAHGCFWKYHPLRAWAWELRLQDEIGPAFRIEEDPYRGDGGHEAHRTVLLADHPIDALATIEREAFRRSRKHKRPFVDLSLLEPGLWTARPQECWTLELKLTEKQGTNFLLLAPDEPKGRAALLAAMPDLPRQRQALLASLRPTDELFAPSEEDGEDEDGEGDAEDDGDDGETE